MSSGEEEDDNVLMSEEDTPVKPSKRKPAPAKPKTTTTTTSQVDEINPNTGVGRSDSAKKALEKKFEKLTPREHVLKRPDTYVGSTESVTQSMWVLNESNGMEERTITFVPALYKIFDEILVNAADNKARDATMKEIRVDIDQASGRITCRNDGKGIPVEKHDVHGMYIPEMIFGHLLTGENFNDEEQRVVGGRNGYGAKLANIFSTEFQITTNDKTSDQCYVQVWKDNMSVCGKPKITKAKAKDFTEVSFVPDYPRFSMDGPDKDMMALFKKRVYDVSGVTDKSVKVYLNGDLISCNTFEKYVRMFTEISTSSTGAGEDGGEEVEAGSASKKKPSVPFVYAELNPRWQIALACSKDGSPQQVSFVNSICTYKGGQHVAYLQDKVAKFVMEYIEKKHKGQASVVKPQQIKNHLWLFCNSLIVNPSFDSQTKENLTTKPAKFGPKEFLPEIPDDVLTKLVKNTNLIESVLYWANAKQMKDLKKVGGGKKKISLMDIPKLDDANNAGGKKSEECTLILTEGDSAKTLALSGISVVGRDSFGVFPLKGKLLNVREASHVQIMKNMEIQNIMRILGLKVGEKYDNCKNLRYGRVLIMTDQDQDGSHIKGLVFNFFHFYFPSLLKIPGFLQVFVTPLVKISKERGPKETLSFYSSREYDNWRSQVCEDARQRALAKTANLTEDALKSVENSFLKSWRVKYYKGLGTNSSKEAQEYFAKITTHTIEMKFDGNSSDALDMAFSKARVEDRKKWLNSHNPDTFSQVDFRAKSLDYKHFVDGELVLFSLADNVRSIPSAVDGFKPSQRKVLYACLKRNLVNEIKVSQLSGYVSEHGAYHHGEESLSGAIVNMAQSFVGSNNIPLLHAGGAFGTRRMGGKDAASGRYIFTKLLKITRAIFPAHDDPLLKRVEDDGMVVEPISYVPILPMLLVNGSSGIGTGWSTEIPAYDPKQIIQILFDRLGGGVEPAQPLKPFYKGFSGQILEETKPKKGPTGRFLIRGKFELLGDKLFITELPVGKWTATYKDFLLEQANQDSPTAAADDKKPGAKGKKTAAAAAAEKAEPAFGKKSLPPGSLLEIRENHTDETVDFELTLTPEFANALREGGAELIMNTFQLQTTISTTNLTAFNREGHIQKFESPEEIIDEFYAVRLPLYSTRKQYLEKELAREGEKLSSQARFVRMIVEGELVLSKKKRAEVLDELQRLKFPKWFKTKAQGDEPEPAEPAGEGEDTVVDEKKVTVGGYEYLLSMTFWNLTVEKLAALEAKAREKQMELNVLQKKTPEDLWREDLKALELVMAEMEIEELELRKEQMLARGKAGGKGKLGRGKASKYVASEDDDDEDDEEDEEFGKKKKKKPTAKQAAARSSSAPSPAAKRGGGITEMDLKPPVVVTAEEIAAAKLLDEAKKAKALLPKVKKEPVAKKPRVARKSGSGGEEEEDNEEDGDSEEDEEVAFVPRARPTARAAAQKKIVVVDLGSDEDEEDDDEEDDDEVFDGKESPAKPASAKKPTPKKALAAAVKKPAAAVAKKPAAAAATKKPSAAKKRIVEDDEDDEIDDPEDDEEEKPKRAVPAKKKLALDPEAAAAKPKRAAPAKKKEEAKPKGKKKVVDSDDDEEEDFDFSPSPKKKAAAAKPAAAGGKKALTLAERLGVKDLIDQTSALPSAPLDRLT
ncbi:hypothetical protein BASA81_005874 [Batrachochytrium salamandrivorans]|nr:hypothetical protein BASA81_005874 [Batrachochytrium salamandrivorans]